MVLIRPLRTLRRLGGKVAGVVRSVGSKVSDVLLRATPAVAAFAPELSAGIAAAGGIARGVSTVAGLAEGACAAVYPCSRSRTACGLSQQHREISNRRRRLFARLTTARKRESLQR